MHTQAATNDVRTNHAHVRDRAPAPPLINLGQLVHADQGRNPDDPAVHDGRRARDDRGHSPDRDRSRSGARSSRPGTGVGGFLRAGAATERAAVYPDQLGRAAYRKRSRRRAQCDPADVRARDRDDDRTRATGDQQPEDHRRRARSCGRRGDDRHRCAVRLGHDGPAGAGRRARRKPLLRARTDMGAAVLRLSRHRHGGRRHELCRDPHGPCRTRPRATLDAGTDFARGRGRRQPRGDLHGARDGDLFPPDPHARPTRHDQRQLSARRLRGGARHGMARRTLHLVGPCRHDAHSRRGHRHHDAPAGAAAVVSNSESVSGAVSWTAPEPPLQIRRD